MGNNTACRQKRDVKARLTSEQGQAAYDAHNDASNGPAGDATAAAGRLRLDRRNWNDDASIADLDQPH